MNPRNSLLLLAGAAAALLSAGTAKAAGSFAMNFVGTTGATGTMAFDFTQGTGNMYAMTIDITNTTGSLQNATSSWLTGFAISFPDAVTGPSPLYGYDPLASPFTTTFVDANIGGLATFDVCAISGSSNSCNGAGSGNEGLPSPSLNLGPSTAKVQFTFTSTQSSADDVSQAFQAFINNPPPTQNPAVALRFQVVEPGGRSDKVGGNICVPGTPNCTPGGAPGDTVPGPLPLFGAAAAFGYSRKLRRRINTTALSS